ncbi:TPA: hypothetical protein MJE11_12965 [Klebsiella pneumoniae]|uniref:hypothetical protein n=1 Tax=Klebsiella pneumoniae TaxID=573 RepID=UPI0003BE06B2|nr:hypothetical protein [Klebsiella pneumoniae]ESM96513.1 hypothetical protein L376_03830 [Klebsiella pneumoniae MGH 30]MDE4660742.1 hypothetical protein [Klebsiella pneumoniae]MDE4707214.1 hypothetical protein [Klebsiella pneumoniae]MDK6237797.1 hypothetical protein [Klebsiella pneumoniae]OUI16940.1 hypothetical protein AZZ73_000503 [Klebsiella pneumoniae]
MNISTVNELIQSLESAVELSIKETKVKALAKAYQQLAAENVALKSKGKELLGEACAVYSRLNKMIDPSIGDFVDGQTLHEFQFVLDAETPATDRIVAGIKADGVEMFVEKCREESMRAISSDIRNNWWLAGEHAEGFAAKLREGDGK